MNPATSYAHCDPSDRADLAWDAVNEDDAKVKRFCEELVAREYPFLKSPGDVVFAIYRDIIGPKEIDTQVRELIAREAETTKLRRVK